MTERSIDASTFTPECLALLDEVVATGATIVITKRGKPVARVVAVEEPPSLRGSVTFNVSEEELIYGRLVEWDAEHE